MTKKTTPPVTVAKLDSFGVFEGMVTIPEEELTSRHLPHITECDLQPGAYRWDDEGGRFVPLPKQTPEKAVKAPDTLRAIAKGFAAVRDSGVALPKETLDWLAWYSQTIDAKG